MFDCDTLFNVAYLRQLNKLRDNEGGFIVGTCWYHQSSGELGKFQTSTKWSMTVQEAWSRGNILFFAFTDPWYLYGNEHMDRSSYNFFEQTHEGRFVSTFHDVPCIVHYKGPLWTWVFAWHRRTGMDKNLVKHRTQLRSRGVELLKVGELIHWKHMHST